MALAAAGSASRRPATPRLPSTSSVENPKGTPAMCGTTARKPKLAPVAVAMVVFGPGVNEPTIENTTKAQSCAVSMRGPKASTLYRHCLIQYRYSWLVAEAR
jgi:hypothetical protein